MKISKHIYNIIPLFGLFLLSFSSCTERIDIKTKDASPALSIFGYITDKPEQHAIKITRTSGYFSTEPPTPISNATVTISDEKDIIRLTENPDTPGVYLTNPHIRAEEGHQYTLDVWLDFNEDGINEHYQAKSGAMPYSTRIDSIVLSPSSLPFIPNLLLYGKVPDNQKNNLAVYLIKNSEPINIFSYFLILPDGYFMGHDIQGYEFPCMVTDGVQLGDTIRFRVNSFTSDFSNFLSHARSESGAKNPIFSGPPSNVASNIVATDPNNDVEIVGYFSAFPQSESSTISDREYMPATNKK